jgi:hypothetical protein
MELVLGRTLYLKPEAHADLALGALIFEGKEIDGFGEIVAINPTTEQIRRYKEINPFADGENKVIYYDEKAERHFIIHIDDIEKVF